MKEKQFWNRILEFAQERLTRSMYDFYAIQAELIKVEENVATIFLPRSEMEMVWEKQLKDIIINEDNLYIICNTKIVDNERMMTWGFTANFFYGSFNNFSNIKIRYDNPGIIDNNTHDILVAGVVDFIYSNVKLGLL